MRERLRRAIADSPMGIMEIERKSGVARCNIYQFLNGERYDMRGDNIRRLCKTLGISADWLLGIKENGR